MSLDEVIGWALVILSALALTVHYGSWLMLHVRTMHWQVETREHDDADWVAIHEGTRFATAIRTYNDLEHTRKRLLCNGRVMRLQTTSDELDLFHEEA